MTTLKEAKLSLLKDDSIDNQNAFAKAFKQAADEGMTVQLVGNPAQGSADDFELAILGDASQQFIAVNLCDSADSPCAPTDIPTDINNVLDILYSNPGLAGLVIDPMEDQFIARTQLIYQIMLHSEYPYQDNGGSGKKDWGEGVPKYQESDLMTEGQMLNFTMHSIIESDLMRNEYEVVSACDNTDAPVNLVLKKDGEYILVAIKAHCDIEEPELTSTQIDELKALGEKYHAKVLWAPAGIASVDPNRWAKNLALKGDGFLLRYDGLRPVE